MKPQRCGFKRLLKPQRAAPLTREQLETAFRLIERSWETDGSQMPIPAPLQHLSEMDWERLCRMLLNLKDEAENSSLH